MEKPLTEKTGQEILWTLRMIMRILMGGLGLGVGIFLGEVTRH